MIKIALPWLSLLVSVVLPAVVALVTKRYADSGLKAIVLAALAAVTGLCTEWIAALNTGTAFDWNSVLNFWVTSFLVAVAAHYGLLKPVGLSGTNGLVSLRTARAGIGRHRAEAPAARRAA